MLKYMANKAIHSELLDKIILDAMCSINIAADANFIAILKDAHMGTKLRLQILY